MPRTVPSVAVVGLGLIGGSLALALRRAGFRVTGIDRDLKALALARRRGAVHHAVRSLPAGLPGTSVVILCVPLQAVPACLRVAGRCAPPQAVLTDAASVKVPVIAEARRLLPAPDRFVGGHPMAGSERSGMTAASAHLFRGRPCVLTPVRGTSSAAVRRVAALWRACGAGVMTMSPLRHDAVVARISHLPHLLAFALAAELADPLALRLASGSFSDATRVAGSDPGLWGGILRANDRAVRAAWTGHRRRVGELLGSLRRPQPGELLRRLRRARALRRRLA